MLICEQRDAGQNCTLPDVDIASVVQRYFFVCLVLENYKCVLYSSKYLVQEIVDTSRFLVQDIIDTW